MKRREILLISIIMVLITAACIKETYNMDKLSDKGSFSPTLALAAIKGDISLTDMIKASDTVVFGADKSVKIVFKEDTAIFLDLKDMYNFDDMVTFSDSYTIGPITLANFQGNVDFTLNQIVQSFSSPALKATFLALNGTTQPFPSFPSTTLPETSIASFPNFKSAVFKSGFIDISVVNNLPAPLGTITISLYNSVGHTLIGTAVTVPASQPGETQTASINLTDQTVTNAIKVAAVLSGSPGTTAAVPISLTNSGIQITVNGRDLKVKSGEIIIPEQPLTTFDNKDTITFDPGTGIEIDELKMLTGTLSYHIQSTAPLSASLRVTIPSSLRNTVPITETIAVPAGANINGTIPLSNSFFDLGNDPEKPFNRLAVEYAIDINAGSTYVIFNETNMIKMDLQLVNPTFDYLKGYFGQLTETIDPTTMDLDINEILSKVTGTMLISNPSIKFDYLNSFAVPVDFTLNASAKRNTQTVNLGLIPATQSLLSPVGAPVTRDASGSIAINKSNSELPEMISLPPEEIMFSGSAKMNPAGDPNHLRNNYVFGNSRFLGSVEVEIPLEFRFNNLQFTDTIDNFLKDSGTEDNPVKPEDFQLLRVDLTAQNGFPVGVSIKMKLYDPVTKTVKSTIDATDLLKPATIDATGKVTASVESVTKLEFTREFFSMVSKADEIIFEFTLNTTGNGASDVKIYSDYRIDFNAALVVKPEIKFN